MFVVEHFIITYHTINYDDSEWLLSPVIFSYVDSSYWNTVITGEEKVWIWAKYNSLTWQKDKKARLIDYP